LLRWNIFKKEIIAVHGTMMDEQQAKKFRALVWCPASNFFLLGKTAAVKELKASTEIVFGTDSTLTASWNIWEQLRLARNENALSDEELYNSITSTAAAVWKLKYTGDIRKDYWADLVVAKASSFNDFYQLNPADLLLVISRGNIVLFDETLYDSLQSANIDCTNFDKIYLYQSAKYIAGDLSGLVKTIHKYHPGAFFPFKVEAGLPTETL
jgi:cytosine/adenosine deaminase-related metal-dependent hydrolase